MIKLIKRIIKREYPFNKYGWQDFVFNYFKTPSYKRKFWKYHKQISVTDNSFMPFDIVESTVEVLFAQFYMFYSKYNRRFSMSYEELKKNYMYEMEYQSEENKQKAINFIDEMYDDYVTIHHIYKYIIDSRKKNTKLLSDILNEMYKDAKHRFIPTDETKKLFEMVYDVKPKYLKLKWEKNDCGLVSIISKEEVESKTDNYYELEQFVRDLDTNYARKIIKLRGYLWD